MQARESKCKHGLIICARCVVITDAARRMSDQVNARLTFSNPWELRNAWLAFRLQDGSTDGNVYDTKAQAISHVSDYKYWAFFCFRNAMNGANPHDCQLFLDLHRHAYTHGGQLPDPDAKHPQNKRQLSGGPDLIVPTGYYDWITGRNRPGVMDLIPGGRVMGSG